MARKDGKDRGILEWPRESGQWWARVYFNGREKRYKADNKTQAKILYGRLRSEMREGTYFPEKYERPKEVILKTFISEYLDNCTLRSKKDISRKARWWSKLWGHRNMKDITTKDLEKIQSQLLQKGRKAPSTINRYFANLKRVMNLALRDGIVKVNPVVGFKFFKEPKGRLRFLTEGEEKRLSEVMEPADFALVSLALQTGLRQAEQFSLRWECVDLENQVLTIPRSKSGETRHVPLNSEAVKILRGLSSWMTSPWVFPAITQKGPRHPTHFYNRTFLPSLKSAGIEGFRWHDLRHTFASRLVMAGVHLRAVQELMGHKTIEMTLRYSHLSKDHLRTAIESLTVTKTVTIVDEVKQEGVITY